MSIKRLLVLLASISFLGALLLPGAARAEVDLNGLLSDPGISEAGAQDLVAANPGVPYAPESYDGCHPNDQDMPPNFADVV